LKGTHTQTHKMVKWRYFPLFWDRKYRKKTERVSRNNTISETNTPAD